MSDLIVFRQEFYTHWALSNGISCCVMLIWPSSHINMHIRVSCDNSFSTEFFLRKPGFNFKRNFWSVRISTEDKRPTLQILSLSAYLCCSKFLRSVMLWNHKWLHLHLIKSDFSLSHLVLRISLRIQIVTEMWKAGISLMVIINLETSELFFLWCVWYA